MSYLIRSDYARQIQDANLSQIISSDTSILTAAELTAQAEVISYLIQKYQTDAEFTDTSAYSIVATYKATNRVYLDADAYSASSTYALNALTLQAGNVYKCTTAILVGEAFTIGKWSLLGAQYALFYAKYPHPLFDAYKIYAKGDQVFWKDKTYTCLIASTEMTHDQAIQQIDYANLHNYNVFPDNPTIGVQYWGTGSAYTVPAGSLLNTTYFTSGDNRSYQMITYMIDVCLYHLHCRIAPRNVPQVRIDRYTAAIMWLQQAGRGEITANLPLIQPKAGSRIRYGGRIKNINSY